MAILLLLLVLSGVQVDALGAEFRDLRQVPGHFGGGGWNSEVDAWNGRKHRVMEALGEALARAPEERITAVMGPPDDPAGAWSLVQPPAGTTHLLVYRWRGMHDFLYFLRSGSEGRGSGWWMALE